MEGQGPTTLQKRKRKHGKAISTIQLDDRFLKIFVRTALVAYWQIYLVRVFVLAHLCVSKFSLGVCHLAQYEIFKAILKHIKTNF